MATESRKRKRTALDLQQKKNIVEYHDEKCSHQQIADHFSTLWYYHYHCIYHHVLLLSQELPLRISSIYFVDTSYDAQ